MSIQALEWARRQCVGDALAKSLLRAIADYADENGHCWPSLGRLAADCEVSEDTIRRKTKLLEDARYLVRIRAWMDEHGRRNFDGNGRETSHELRLQLGRAPSDPADVDSHNPPDEGSQPARVAACEGSTPATPGVALVLPPNEPSSNKKDSPPNPPPGGGVPEGIQGKAESGGEVLPDHTWPGSDTWFAFEKAWEEPIVHHSKARGFWSALTETERQTAITAAKGYVVWRRAQRRPPALMNAHRFLQDPDAWPSFCQQAAKAEQVAQQIRVAADSREGMAYRTIRRLGGACAPLESNGCYWLPRPLTPQELAFAELPPESEWSFLESGIDVRQLGAWKEFFAAVLKGVTRGEVVRDHGVGAKSRRGCKMPWPWPPKKDGSLSTAPPQESHHVVSDEDASALT